VTYPVRVRVKEKKNYYNADYMYETVHMYETVNHYTMYMQIEAVRFQYAFN
jgi:hypothetical protein